MGSKATTASAAGSLCPLDVPPNNSMSTADEPATATTDEGASADGGAVTVDENGHGRIVFRHELLRKFGTVWETRAVNDSPCAGVRFSYFNNSKNAHNSNILQVILRDHGFHKTEPPDGDWNVFWCAGQVCAGRLELLVPATSSHRLSILPSLHLRR